MRHGLKRLVAGLGLTALMMTGCAMGQEYRPLVDYKASPGKTQVMYEQDLDECQQYAAQVETTTPAASQALGGAALGGVLGGVGSSILGGGFMEGAGAGAAVGAIGGGVRGATSAGGTREAIIRNCMNGRGYSVLQ